MATKISPEYRKTSFNCLFCNAYSQMYWSEMRAIYGSAWQTTELRSCTCHHCKKMSVWLNNSIGEANHGVVIYPNEIFAPASHSEMPEEIAKDFDEARQISSLSPRGAAALLRLCIQKLCVVLGESGKNINEDIRSLVQKGLPVEIQQALDIVRVIGNNAVHPGELNPEEITQHSIALFELVNQIVEDRIARPKKLASLFSGLPAAALTGIVNRDSQKSK